MSNLFVLKEQLQTLYTRNSKYIDKAVQFVLGLFVFGFINANLGFMKMAASPLITLALALACSLLPIVFTVIAATILVLVHFYALSMPIAIVVAGIFLVMFIFYFRFTPQQALLLLLTPLAFALKIPYIIPIAYGLVGTPVYAIPITCGTITYYILSYVKTSATTITSSEAEGVIEKITIFIKQVFQNREMLVMVVAFILCLLLVYSIRKMGIDHAWKFAIVVGAITNVVVLVVGDILLDIHYSYILMVVGSIVSVLIAIVLEFMIFSVDYSRTERMEFEDDEYYYYVKAVPKIFISAPEKTVKRINERQETSTINAEEVNNIVTKRQRPKQGQRPATGQNRAANRSHGSSTASEHHRIANEVLLEKSLNEELNL